MRQLEHSLTDTLVRRDHSGREFWVIFTDSAHTSDALSLVASLAEKLSARICILAAQVVPYPLPLPEPCVDPKVLECALLGLALSHNVDTTVQICLCRDSVETLNQILPAGAIVVIGGRKRWWQTPEQRLARALAQKERTVFFFDPARL